MNKALVTLVGLLIVSAPSAQIFAETTQGNLKVNVTPEKTVVTPAVPVDKVTVKMDVSKSDMDVAKAVKDSFAVDPAVSSFASNVDVKVDKGVVTLSGNVPTDKAKADFERLAKGVMGVNTVVNNVVVKK